MMPESHSILVVDDSLVVQLALRKSLTPFGFAVRGCKHSDELLDKVRDENPDLVIVSPTDEARTLLDGMRQDAQLAGLPVVLHSSRPLAELAQVVSDWGANAAVEKGTEPEQFAETLARLLRIR